MGTKEGPSINYGRTFELIPDYLTDLNAMHEAEKVLTTADLRESYENFMFWDEKGKYPLWGATATQRAEAFLRTLNLWKP
jgi:hypothetical protein